MVALREREHCVAHDQRGLGRIEDDDRLAALGAAELADRLRGRLGELVDIGARAGAGRFRGDRGDDLAPDHAIGRAAHGVNDRDRRLSTAGDHVDVRLVEIGVAVYDGDRERSYRRRRQVDHLLAVALQNLVVADMRARPRRRRTRRRRGRSSAAIAKTESHGCIRLTNWDAVDLAAMVRPGTAVKFEG